MCLAPPARTRSSPAMGHPYVRLTLWTCTIVHILVMSRPKCQKIWHFVSYPAELHPIRLGQQRQREFGPEQRRQCRDRKSVGKPVPAGDRFAQTKRIEL